MERLLSHPLIAKVDSDEVGPGARSADPLMDLVGSRYVSQEARSSSPWKEDASDGSVTVRVQIDYDGAWEGDQGARAALEAIKGAMDGPIACMPEYQLQLLRRNPRDFVASTNREVVDLVGYETDRVGRYPRIIALRLGRMPNAAGACEYLAIVPNLVQLERQLAALDVLSAPGHEVLEPLRALVGSASPECLETIKPPPEGSTSAEEDSSLDGHQQDCVAKVLASPHFTVIQGPPGSGKTTVIANIVKRGLSRGWRMLVASSTHVAVDNIVEKLAKPHGEDDLMPSSTPLRWASKLKAVAPAASGYWVGGKKQHRIATIARRLEAILGAKLPGAAEWFGRVDPDALGQPLLTCALAANKPVLCGTPIGILGCDDVSHAAPGTFDLLVVDEVSKMTVPEFLAIAVKAKRWCLVGDPAQMPPFCDATEVAATLADNVPDEVELVCSVAACVERAKPDQKSAVEVLVVTDDPVGVERAIREHAEQVQLRPMPPVQMFHSQDSQATQRGILVCAPGDLPGILEAASIRESQRQRRVLLQRGVRSPSGIEVPLIRDVDRSEVSAVEIAYYTYHALPWARERNHKLPLLGLRNGLEKYSPSLAALQALRIETKHGGYAADLAYFELAVARSFATHCISVYDWLTGIPSRWFTDLPVLRRLAEVVPEGLSGRVGRFVGRLAKQYRMHPSLSAVPREEFYQGESLLDGVADNGDCAVRFLQVVDEASSSEENVAEADAIATTLPRLLAAMPSGGSVMVITPYRAQERALRDRDQLSDPRVEVCTLDRCQGREADYVFISLVRGKATPFLDMPKRWNVALTRARKGLFFVGNVDSYLREARQSRSGVRPGEPSKSSLLAKVIDAYDRLLQGRRQS